MNQQVSAETIREMIKEYAYLKYMATLSHSHRQKVPSEITLKMAGMEAWARAYIHPNSHPALLQEVDQELTRYHVGVQTGMQHLKGADRERALGTAVEKLTRGILGQPYLNPHQLAAIVAGRSLRAEIPKQSYSQYQKDQQIKAATKHLDPHGEGYSEKEFTRRMNQLADADANEFVRLIRYYKVPKEEARKVVAEWKVKRLEYGLKGKTIERQTAKFGESKSTPVLHSKDIKDADHRKATLATAMLADASDQASHGDSDGIRELTSPIHPSYLEGNDRRAALANAFQQVEYAEAG